MMTASLWPLTSKAQSEPPIPAHRATYAVFYDNKPVGEIEFVLEKANEAVWHIKTQTHAKTFLAKTLGSDITEAAHFMWQPTDEGWMVTPLTYHQVSREPFRTRYWQHHFDWNSKTTETLTHEGTQTLVLIDGLVDPLTLRLALASQLMSRSEQPLEKNESLPFWVLDRDDVESQQMNYLGRELIEVPAGCFEALRFYRLRKEGSARNYGVWVSEQTAWLPIQMIQRDGSREIRIELLTSELIEDSPSCKDQTPE